MQDAEFLISEHAREEAERRGISLDLLEKVLESPEQIVDAHSNRQAFQSRVDQQ